MQILSSGSFINLETREKIEQLIFTARELANAASQTLAVVPSMSNNSAKTTPTIYNAALRPQSCHQGRFFPIFLMADPQCRPFVPMLPCIFA